MAVFVMFLHMIRITEMRSIAGQVALAVFVYSLAGFSAADTREGYENSTTRQQIERMDENARANARDTPNVPSTGIQGSALEGQLNRLHAEQQAEKEAKAEIEARKKRELREWSIRYDELQAEIKKSRDEQLVRQYAEERQALDVTRASMASYVKSLPADQPVSIANYDHLLEMAELKTEAMLPVVQMAYRDFPKEFVLRYAFLQLSSCPGLRTSATASSNSLFPEEEPLRAQCKAQQLAAALPYLDQARQTGDTLDKALSCALMAGAYASLDVYENNGFQQFDTDVMRPRIAAWLDKRLAPCATAVPPGSPLYTGLVEPLVRDAERTDDNRLRVSQHSLWPLVARKSWAGVDINNADAVHRAYKKATAHIKAAPPRSAAMTSEYFIWFVDFPQVKMLELKPGIDTQETVLAALGKPAATVSRESLDVVPDIRQACRSSSYQHQLDRVLRYEGSTSFKRFGSRRKMEQVVHVFFDGQGRLCAAEVTRDWTLPGAYTSAIGIFHDGPGGRNDPRWRERGHQFR